LVLAVMAAPALFIQLLVFLLGMEEVAAATLAMAQVDINLVVVELVAVVLVEQAQTAVQD
jgi:hypothetical protein